MIVQRYIIKDICLNVAAIAMILIFIFLSNQFVDYLARAASGQMSLAFVFKVMLLEIPNLLGLLLPIALFLGILTSISRLYAENELTIFQACGMSQAKLLSVVLIFASVVTLIVAFFSLWLSPKVAQDRNYLLATARANALFDLVIPGHFLSGSEGKAVVYVNKVSKDRQHFQELFAARKKWKKTKTRKVTGKCSRPNQDN